MAGGSWPPSPTRPHTETPPRGGRHARGDRLRRPGRPLPTGTTGALLPDARLGARGGGPGPGDDAARMAGLGALRRRRRVDAHVALQDRDQRLPDRVTRPRKAPVAVGPGQAERRPGRTDGAVVRNTVAATVS